MDIFFGGAASEVTGSKHLISVGDEKVLLDCGLSQGHREAAQENSALPFSTKGIKAVIISHAHLDHIGMLPLLVKAGYHGPIYATASTIELTELLLLDSAKIQEQDAFFAAKHHLPNPPQPLYTHEDIPPVMKLMQPVRYRKEWLPVTPSISLRFLDAGHILGSAITELRITENGKTRGLVYTGDLGRAGMPLLHDPDMPDAECDTLLMEATYGTRLHHGLESVEEILIAAVKRAVETNGKIIVPAFSLGRTQALVYLLHRLTDQNKIPRIPIIVDSPLSQRITDVYNRHQREYDAETKTDFTEKNENPLVFRNLEYTQSVDESKGINGRPGPMMILSASGMATGGRVMHHLRNNLGLPSTTILITGYQASRTLGRSLVEGAKRVHIFGDEIPVKATIMTANDLSAHADGRELQAFAEACNGLKRIFLVHSEMDRADALRVQIQQARPDWKIDIPKVGQTFSI